MYLTAQQVRGPTGDAGVNAFVHRHPPDFVWPATARAQAELPDEDPGVLVARDLQVTPGGNRVEAFLDLVAPEDLPPAHLLSALDEFRRTTSAQALPRVVSIRGVVLRFGLNLGLYGSFRDLLDSLATSIEGLIAAHLRGG